MAEMNRGLKGLRLDLRSAWRYYRQLRELRQKIHQGYGAQIDGTVSASDD